MSRKDKKSIKKRTAEAQQLQNIEDIGDIGDFDAIAALDNYLPYTTTTGTSQGSGGGDDGGGEKMSKSSSSKNKGGKDSATQSLQLAVKAFASSAKIGGTKRTVNTAITYNDDDMRDDPSTTTHINTTKKPRTDITSEGQNYHPYGDDNDDDDDAYMQVESTATHNRRRAPSGPMSTTTADQYNSDNEDGHNSDPHTSNNNTSNILDEFIKKKKDYLKKKKEHYTVEPIYSGIDDHLTTPSNITLATTTTTDNNKRGITYEILKNKGVTPYRKLINRNPRVKKRKAYEKAIISRKGQVREVITGVAGAYGGELTGIKSGLARSRKF